MLEKKRLNEKLDAAATLRQAGQFVESRDILNKLASDPDIDLLGSHTSLGLPRRLQSALLKLAKAEKNAVMSIGYQYHLVPPPELLGNHTRYTGAQRRALTAVNRTPVPHKIHQIWIGPSRPPIGTQAWEVHAREQQYDYQLWNEDKLNALGLNNNPVYTDMLSKGDFPGAVDVARYVILEKVGGVYVDCDWYPTRNDVGFHDFLPMIGLTTLAEDIPRNTGKGGLLLANSMIATPPQHPVFTRLLAVLNDVMTEIPNAPAWWATGPLIFTLMARGGSVTLADGDLVAGGLAQATPEDDVKRWCQQAQVDDSGLLLAWKSWVWR